MSVAIRMRKVGKGIKKNFYFRVGVIDEQKSRDGKMLEDIGVYEPAKKENNFRINKERFDYWKSKGAVISDTVRSLVKKSSK
ncbi:MAG: 30S ribosomal protein S16 [Omnitrophica WOR_2 bacterium GWF2_43_52]|nr:MAG: 30S ribosomal protein S16 [Omnitrophica WOR_2 bacterium GWA2_44_7]OGX16752.1 MAG: 30S ribosomal protein S16 [Omnitrophica WOR_2 bacterium GWC2_44_8]OGX21153.1 MAG: 30S ribosomal protein S16 [Omnitrophica WOR_2 bacterium GWF2_43_52]OGX54020.1 MAG: 30S ribosomal protein S16 [Omnitrophica WOR_2 bacterium RIFOXYC2_FULL_43_9]